MPNPIMLNPSRLDPSGSGHPISPVHPLPGNRIHYRDHTLITLLRGLVLVFLIGTASSAAWGRQTRTAPEETKIVELRIAAAPGSAAAPEPKSNAKPAAPAVSPGSPVSQEPPVNLGAMQLRGSVEFGARWRDVVGNDEVYRSHVNLGNGAKLLHSDVEISSPENVGTLFDRFRMTMDNWGGDPYNTSTVRVQKFRIYDFQYRYSKINYFNFVPEFANPLFAEGILEGQHTFDITRRMSNARVDFFPDSKRFKFHLTYGRNHSFGPSLITYNAGGDEFVLPRNVTNSYDDYGVGVDFSLWKFKFSFEQGYRRFRDDQGVSLAGNYNIGNDRNPIFEGEVPLPEQLYLSAFSRSYHVRGTFPTTRFAVTVQPHRRIALTARFYYGDANLQYAFSQALAGLVFNRSFQSYMPNTFTQNVSAPTRPQTVADWSLGIAVTNRLTISNTFRFNHFNVYGSTLVNELLFLGSSPFGEAEVQELPLETLSSRRIFYNSYWDQAEARYEFFSGFLVRAGFRHTHRKVDIQKYSNDLLFGGEDTTIDRSNLDTRTFLAGVSYRLKRRIRIAFDYENGGYDNVYTMVGPVDQQRGRLRVQYRPTDNLILTLTGMVTDMDRTNRPVIRPFIIPPTPDSYVRNQDRYRDGGFSLSYFPSPRIAFDVDYTRGHAASTINLLFPVPGELPLKYREDSHVAHAAVDLGIYKDLKMSMGYSLVNNDGSYPMNYHRPYGRISIPIQRRLILNVNYQYYGYDERGRRVQNYHANMLTTSFKIMF
ncbi:MAG: hypothetical protein HY650_09270 [Acidobacteria bacterium]|nr:hypothetical protein [Acidobacteriota bacterium]